MRAWWVVLSGLAGAGCYPAAAALAIMPVATTVAPVPFRPQMNISVSAARATADDEATGWQANLTTAFAAGQPVGLASYSRLELGSFGEGLAGTVEGTLGISGGTPGIHGALLSGFAYGGYPQNGKTVPLRLLVLFDMEAVALRATGYVGWRFDTAGERPEATDKLGPWNTWGASIDATVHQGIGPMIGVGFERQDDITTMTLHFGIAGHAPTL
jgi:hypothetical protein